MTIQNKSNPRRDFHVLLLIVDTGTLQAGLLTVFKKQSL